MAVSIAKLRAQLILDTENWLNGFGKAEKAAKSFGSKITSTLGSKVTGALAGIVSVGAAIHNLQQGMDQVDRQAKLADRLGITVGEVQKLSLAADLAGTDVELLARSMLKMGKNIGSGGQSLDKRLFQVADSIASIKDAGKRGAEAERIFGKGGLELINVLAQGSAGIRNSADAIDRFGLSLSRIDAAKIEAANDSMTELKTVLGGLRNEVAVSVAPAITNFIQDWLRGLELIRKGYMDIEAAQRDATKNTFMDIIGVAGLHALNGLSGGTFGDERGALLGLREMRQDALKNAAFGGGKTGAALLGRSALGGTSGRSADPFGSLQERGSVAAAVAISGVGQDSPTEIAKKQQATLTLIERNTAAAARRISGTPLRSNLRGVGM